MLNEPEGRDALARLLDSARLMDFDVLEEYRLCVIKLNAGTDPANGTVLRNRLTEDLAAVLERLSIARHLWPTG